MAGGSGSEPLTRLADLLLGEVSGRELLPAEQQRVGHLSEGVQVDEPHPSLIQGIQINLCLLSLPYWQMENLPDCLCRHQTQLQQREGEKEHFSETYAAFINQKQKERMLTVFIQEVVLDVLAEEKLDCLTDLLPLLQNVLVILRMIPLGDSWERGEAS